MFKSVSFALFYFLATNLSAEEITLDAHDGFKLSASYLSANGKNPSGVLMLHQCNASKEMYSSLAKELSIKGISSLALDFRGFGNSTTPLVSKEKARKTAKNRKDYLKKLREIQQHWTRDVELAFRYLADRVGKNNISYIGTSCGGGQTIELAQKHKPKSFVIFSSGLDKKHRALYENVTDIPALIIAAQGDENTYEISHRMFLKGKNKQTRFISYKGKEHGRTLFKLDPDLQSTMVNWFKQY